VLAKGKRRSLFLLYMLILGSAAMESIGIASFYPVVDMLQDVSQLDYYKNKISSEIPALESLSREQFFSCFLLATGALFIFKNLFFVVAEYGNIRVVVNLYYTWVNRIFSIYLKKPYAFFLENKAGDLVQRKIVQTQKASGAIRLFVILLGRVTTILAVFLVLGFVNLPATLVILLLMVPLYYATMKVSQAKLYKLGEGLVQLEKQGFSLTTEVLSGIKQIKIFCAEENFQGRINKIWNEYSRHSIQNQFLVALPRPILESVVVIAGVTTMIMLMATGQEKELFPLLAVFAVGLYRVLPLAAGASAVIMGFASVLPATEAVADLIKESEEKNSGYDIPPIQKNIEFRNVSFSYKGRESVLKKISLKFEKNKFYGIVGVSGSGKSTIIDLIAGFFSPQKGQVLIDGIDLANSNKRTWLCQMGLISQDAFIFSGTIEDNICLGVDSANRDKNRLKKAAQIAYADEFIDPLPEGYQTIIGERGAKLSGGQRQRLAIARAIYLNPPVLVFDEATSSLDANSERKIHAAMQTLQGQRTIIVVTHRLATISNADCIYVIEKGSLTEEGAHEKLKAGNGLYNSLCAKQSLI
tara:strand:- start:1091 stop:2842 length:1752 start_codon:yes stop_codon:yes gene_type:complete